MTKKKVTTKKAKAANEETSKPSTSPQAQKAKEPKEDLVVFAFRLKAEERDLIHKAAGPAKASKFIRTLAVAASRGDVKAVSEIVGAVNG